MTAPGPEHPAHAASDKRFPLCRLWLVLALVLTALAVPAIAGLRNGDPDDSMRLLQVRAWLDGQGWFDSRQYRIDPPFGADMHWVRLVDLPLAAATLLFRIVLDKPGAELAAMIAIPLLQLLVAMWLIDCVMRSLRADRPARIWALVLLPLFPMLAINMMPMRIDHHGWQAIAALASAWQVLRGGYRAAALGGIVTAGALFISLEGMAFTGVIAAIYAWKYWHDASPELEAYLLGITTGAIGFLFALIPVQDFATPRCDMVSWPQIGAFAASLAVVFAGRLLPGQDGKRGRFLLICVAPIVAAPIMLAPLGICAISPMAMVEPLVRNNWQAYLLESAPVWQQNPSGIAMALALPVLIAFGYRYGQGGAPDCATKRSRLTWLVMALGASAIGLLLIRGAILAQLLALPVAGMTVAAILPKARAVQSLLLRALATSAVIVGATPALPMMLTSQFDPRVNHSAVRHPALLTSQPCNYQGLTRLPKAHILADLETVPRMLVLTNHTAVAAGYHRNQARLRDVILAFGGPLENARAIVKANNVQYVVACQGSADLAGFANMRDDNLADRIFADNPPAWLEELMPLRNGSLRVYLVK